MNSSSYRRGIETCLQTALKPAEPPACGYCYCTVYRESSSEFVRARKLHMCKLIIDGRAESHPPMGTCAVAFHSFVYVTPLISDLFRRMAALKARGPPYVVLYGTGAVLHRSVPRPGLLFTRIPRSTINMLYSIVATAVAIVVRGHGVKPCGRGG